MIKEIFSPEPQIRVTDTAEYVLAPDVFFLLIRDCRGQL